MITRTHWNEDDLRADIVSVWGEHGAHADVLDHLVKLAYERNEWLEGIRALVHNIDLGLVSAEEVGESLGQMVGEV